MDKVSCNTDVKVYTQSVQMCAHTGTHTHTKVANLFVINHVTLLISYADGDDRTKLKRSYIFADSLEDTTLEKSASLRAWENKEKFQSNHSFEMIPSRLSFRQFIRLNIIILIHILFPSMDMIEQARSH